MSNFNERHPPMGSEKDIDNQATTSTSSRDQYIAHSTSSSDEELDELSLRVRALLAEIDEEIPEISTQKKSPVHQVSQISSQFSETGFDSQAAKNCECTAISECQHHADKGFFQKKEREHASESHTDLKDSTSKTDTFYGVCESASYSYSTKMLEENKVPLEEQTESCISEDFLSSSDVTIIQDSHPDICQSSVKSNEKQDISKDSSSYYPVKDDLEKQHVNYHLKGRCYCTNLPLLDSSFSTGTQFFYYTPFEDEEKLTVDEKSDFSSYSTARFSPQQSGDKEDKECPSWSRYSDRDTPSLSISSIASSKRLEWDNAADIGYAEDTVDENNPQKKSRREPEGFSLAAHKFSYTSSKYSKTAPQQSSAKGTSIIYEREQPSEVSQSLDIHDRSLASEGSISSIKKDFSKEDKSTNEKTLQYSSAKSSMVTESISNSHKEPKLPIHPDLSVRPKDRAYMKKDRNYERRNTLPKDQSFVSERDTEYLKEKESEISKSDFDKNVCQNKDSETSKKRVSFVPSESFEGNVNIVNFIKPEGDTTSTRSFEPQSYQPICDLPEECQRHILSGPVFIDSSTLANIEYSNRPVTDNPISTSDVLPHIRWYPIPLYRSSQDIRNVSTQTSVQQSKETGTSSEIPDDLDQIFVESSDVAKRLHMAKTVDRNPVNLYSLPPGWQSNEGVNSASQFTSKYIDDSDMRLCSSLSANAVVPNEFITTSQERNELNQNVIESSDVVKPIYMTRTTDRNPLSTSHKLSHETTYKNVEEMDFESLGVGTMKVDDFTSAVPVTSVFSTDSLNIDANLPGSFIGTERDKQKFSYIPAAVKTRDASDLPSIVKAIPVTSVFSADSLGMDVDLPGSFIGTERDRQKFRYIPAAVRTKDASTQVKNCDCNDFKNMLRKALSKLPAENECPLYKHLMDEFGIERPTGSIPHCSEGYDILILDDNTLEIIDAEKSPLYFSSKFTWPMAREVKKSLIKKLPKKVKQRTAEQKRKKIEKKRKVLRMLYQKKATEYSAELAKCARDGEVDHSCHELILKPSKWYCAKETK